ncbi:acyl-CoA thioesterase/bile acid-CoA:amino acid N-acyltransferase family protein [Plantactinospora sp. KBS50]|uniref:acyl-CoA thioesterase/bile acid-CoA:amino acid N-acyltransferase family protein n=1 Tax=Plantactinospora sp. KBS50 TaxID=2024580 RepID=UPI000BAB067D|nr:acyl-CoA thioesterase/bile acid-CoA:amino acid N-acyltransferase family protein [Plantactinospora sp. KBS50]ASW54473.1 hypothetical protein CIK06_10165 [Plantactinospora sp. KBS50]
MMVRLTRPALAAPLAMPLTVLPLTVLLVAGCLGAAGGCAAPREGGPSIQVAAGPVLDSAGATIEVVAGAALVDTPLHIRVSGLRPAQRVSVQARITDGRNVEWQAGGSYSADRSGLLDLDHRAPCPGAYAGVDGMGLLWSMTPAPGYPEGTRFDPPRARVQLRLAVRSGERTIATRTVTRRWFAEGVTRRSLDPVADGLAGELYLPPAGSPRHSGVLLVGGAEGGRSREYDAALLASHGHPALALAYFGERGLPATLRDVPLEYFATAARRLAAEPAVAADGIVIDGASRGAEAALLTAQDHPDLVRGVILRSPSSDVHPGNPGPGVAWTRQGRPVPPGPIPVDRVAAPVLAIAGEADGVWDSARMAGQLMLRLDGAGVTARHRVLSYAEAGHAAGASPYLPGSAAVTDPISRLPVDPGGTPAGNAAAQVQSWAETLAFLDGTGRS